MSINALVPWEISRRGLRSGSWAPFMQSHDRQDLVKIRYSGPVLYFIFKTVLNSRETVLCVKSVFYTALTIRRTRFISAKASRKIISEAVVLVSPKSLQSQQLALRTSKSFNRSVLQMLHNQQLLAMWRRPCRVVAVLPKDRNHVNS